MTPDLAILMLFGTCILPFVLVFVVIIGFAIRRFRTSRSPEGQQQLTLASHRWLDQQRLTLVSWTHNALANISRSLRFRWTEFVITCTTGTVQALQPDAPIIAFRYLHGPSFRSLFASTTLHRWQMRHVDGTIMITLNGQPFGRWQDGLLYDAGGTMIGEAKRPSAWWLNGMPMSWDDQWYDVTLRGQVIGSIFAQRGVKIGQPLAHGSCWYARHQGLIPKVNCGSLPLRRRIAAIRRANDHTPVPECSPPLALCHLRAYKQQASARSGYASISSCRVGARSAAEAVAVDRLGTPRLLPS